MRFREELGWKSAFAAREQGADSRPEVDPEIERERAFLARVVLSKLDADGLVRGAPGSVKEPVSLSLEAITVQLLGQSFFSNTQPNQ